MFNLKNYEVPEWFRDAKFGIFIHWGVYSVPAYGDEWYGHWMYKPDSKNWSGDDIYSYNQMTYPGKGYKDFIPLFKAESFDPDEWSDLFERAGAKYVVPVAMHHDSFAMYDSALTRWKASAMGPKRCIIEELEKAVRKRKMKFGVSNHFAENWWFFPHVDGLDTSDESLSDLYNIGEENTGRIGEHVERWYNFAVEQIDKFKPDLLYFDFEIEKPAYRDKRRSLAAYYYSKQEEWNKGVVLNYKYGAFEEGEAVLDIERGALKDIRPLPWQACTSVSKKSWGYIKNDQLKSAEDIIGMLVDIVSKNGCMLLNIGPRPDGTIPGAQQEILLRIGDWLKTNGEAIYGTRPWMHFGEGDAQVSGEPLKEDTRFSSKDIRFTTSKDGSALYAIVLGPPEADVLHIRSITPDKKAVKAVTALQGVHVNWRQDASGLYIKLDDREKIKNAFAMKII